MKSEIESLGKLLPLGGTFILLCSSLKLILFYREFNINIADYIDLNEYLTLFVDDILLYIAIFGSGIIISYLTEKKFGKIYNLNNKPKTKFKTSEKIYGLGIIGMTILLISLFFLDKKIYEKLTILKLGIFGILLLFYLISVSRNWNFSYYTLILIITIIYSSLDGIIDAYKIKENLTKEISNFEFKDKKLETNEQFVFLGKSKNYVFFYNKQMSRSKIFSLKDIESIEFNVTKQ